LGWTLFFGSSGVLIAWFVLCVVAKFGIVPKEERDLESQFGAAYLRYKNRVPRWLGEVNGSKEEDGAAAK
jgi:protein-S-isoprenylcysteine O-methyltransferase Ste14